MPNAANMMMLMGWPNPNFNPYLFQSPIMQQNGLGGPASGLGVPPMMGAPPPMGNTNGPSMYGVPVGLFNNNLNNNSNNENMIHQLTMQNSNGQRKHN